MIQGYWYSVCKLSKNGLDKKRPSCRLVCLYKYKKEDGERGMTEIESWTVILEKGFSIRDFLKEEIRSKISLL